MSEYPLETDSFKKLLANSFAGAQVPKYLIDLCREVARPMYTRNKIFVPYIDADADRHGQGTFPGIGIGPAQVKVVSTILKNIKDKLHYNLPMRTLIQEDVTVAPFCSSDGKFNFVEPHISTQRKSSWNCLRHLRNGFQRPLGNLKSYRFPNDNAVWDVVLTTVSESHVPDLRDSIVQPDAYLPPDGITNALLLIAASQGIFIDCDPAAATHDWRFFMYYDKTRLDKYSDWFSGKFGTVSLLPPPHGIDTDIRFMTRYTERFPNFETRSSTPNGVRPSMVRKDKLQDKKRSNKQLRRKRQRNKAQKKKALEKGKSQKDKPLSGNQNKDFKEEEPPAEEEDAKRTD